MNDYSNDNFSGGVNYTPGDGTYQNGRSDFSGSSRYQYAYPRKRGKAAKIIAICLACIILAGAAGIGTGIFISSISGVTVTGNGASASAVEPSQDNSTSEPDIPREEAHLDANIVNGSGAAHHAAETVYNGETRSATDIYYDSVDACVGIRTSVVTQNIFGQITPTAISGSGFIISEDGYILTNYHVVETADERGLDITVNLYNGEEYTAKIIGSEEENDVALLKIEASGLKALPINTSGNLLVGETVYALGNPLGELSYTMTKGMLSALDREITIESNKSINMFQMDAAVNSGNSGGPVLNDKGEVIGIVSAKKSTVGVEGLGFAIPIEDAMKIVDDVLKYGYVRGKPYFGITVNTVSASVAEYYNLTEGAFIVELDADSCAAAAGLQTGDIITKMDDHEIRSSSELILTKKLYKAGDTAKLTVYRDGEYFETNITFDEQGAPKAETQTVEG